MGRIRKPRVEMEPGTWGRPTLRPVVASLDRAEGPPMARRDPWLAWDPHSTHPAASTDRILDGYVRIGRSEDPRWQLAAAEAFARRWGPWAYCVLGDHHPPFRPFAGRAGGGWRYSAAGITPASDPRERVADTVDAAQRLDALRRRVLGLWGIETPTACDDDWRRVLGPQTQDGTPPDIPQDDAEERALVETIVGNLLGATHVTPRARFRAPAVLGIGGAAGALAVAILREVSGRPMVASCERCYVTHYRQGRADPRSDGTPRTHLCEACQTTERHRNPKSQTGGTR